MQRGCCLASGRRARVRRGALGMAGTARTTTSRAASGVPHPDPNPHPHPTTAMLGHTPQLAPNPNPNLNPNPNRRSVRTMHVAWKPRRPGYGSS